MSSGRVFLRNVLIGILDIQLLALGIYEASHLKYTKLFILNLKLGNRDVDDIRRSRRRA
jgi:hypothetical protein